MTLALTGRLNPQKIRLDSLFLDANNPRFGSGFVASEKFSDPEIAKESVQKKIISKFETADEPTFKVDDLRQSIKAVGFIPIDQVVVRELSGETGKYVVIEGNRRICSCKLVARELDKETEQGQTLSSHHENVRNELREIYVQVLDTDGLTSSEIEDLEATIVGLRHFGAVAQWGAYAKARHVFTQYLSPGDGHDEWTADEMRLDNDRLKLVKETFSSSKREIERQLKSIVAYAQLSQITDIKPHHFSLLREFVTGRNLSLYVINVDPSTFKVDDVSLQKLINVCQFGEREQLREDDKKRLPEFRLTILNDPKSVGRLNKLAGYLKPTWPTGVQEQARESLKNIMMGLDEDESGKLKQSITIDKALDLAIDANRSVVWVEKLRKQLDQLDVTLDGVPVLDKNKFSGIGSDLESLEKLKSTADALAAVLKIYRP